MSTNNSSLNFSNLLELLDDMNFDSNNISKFIESARASGLANNTKNVSYVPNVKKATSTTATTSTNNTSSKYSTYSAKITAFKNKTNPTVTNTDGLAPVAAIDSTAKKLAAVVEKMGGLVARATDMINLANECIDAGIDISAFKVYDGHGATVIGFNTMPANKITSILTYSGYLGKYDVSISVKRGIRCAVTDDFKNADSLRIMLYEDYIKKFDKFEAKFYAAIDELK